MIKWEYVAGIIVAMGTLIGALSAALRNQRASRSAINLQEDTYLYKRLREQAAKQDNRITHLEGNVEILQQQWRECETHRAACEAQVEALQEQVKVLTGFMRSTNPGLNNDSSN